jgi:lipopolysaccharide export system permease protein
MILFRYLGKEVIMLFAAITCILMVIFLSQEWFRWLSRVAAGHVPMSMMAQLLLLSLPQLLALLLPLSFFFALLLAYGRFYAESEMTAMLAGGMSPRRLSGYSLVMAALVALVAGSFSLGLSPQVMQKRQQLLRQGGLALMIELVVPGRLQRLGRHGPAVYVDRVSNDSLEGVFIAKRAADDAWDIVSATSAKIVEPVSGQRQLVLYNGRRYQGIVGERQFKITDFARFTLPITRTLQPIPLSVKSLTSLYLWQHYRDNLANSAELQWRVSIPLMTLILALISIPLARVSPQQGRYAKVLPGTLIIVVYANLLFFMRTWIKQGSFPVSIGLWGLHVVFLGVAMSLWWWPHSGLKRKLGY